MKRLLLPLLAALALPTAINAEVANYYLLGSADRHTFVVPMKSLGLCEEAGQDFINNKIGLQNMLPNIRLHITV